MSMEIFTKKYAFDTIMMIRDNPGITLIRLQETGKGSEHTIFSMAKELTKEGIIKRNNHKDERNHWNCDHLYLTDKGQRIAAYLDKINRELEGKE